VVGNFLLQGLVDEIGERYIKVWRYSNEGKGTQMKAYNNTTNTSNIGVTSLTLTI